MDRRAARGWRDPFHVHLSGLSDAGGSDAAGRAVYQPLGDGTWQPEYGHVRHRPLLPRDAGVDQTVDLMIDLIDRGTTMDDGTPVLGGARDPYVRAHAEQATQAVPSGDWLGEVVAVRDWIARRVVYRRDPFPSEWLQLPAWVLYQIDRSQRPALDCDDLTVLSLSLLSALGMRTAIIVVSRRADRVLDHVYGAAELRDGGPWVKLDLTDTWRQPGAPASAETRRKEYDV